MFEKTGLRLSMGKLRLLVLRAIEHADWFAMSWGKMAFPTGGVNPTLNEGLQGKTAQGKIASGRFQI